MVPLQALKNGVSKNITTIKDVEAFLEDGRGKRCKEDMLELKKENKTMGVLKHKIETMIDHKALCFIVKFH